MKYGVCTSCLSESQRSFILRNRAPGRRRLNNSRRKEQRGKEMNRYLIKNNIKLMYRSWGNILLFVIMPVILIFCLSSAFETLMSKYEETEMTAGYRIEGDGITPEMIEAMNAVAEENDITLS